MPDPSWQAREQAQQAHRIHQNHVRHHQELHDRARARHTGSSRPHRPASHGPVRGARGGGLAALLLLLLAVAAVVLVAHDPELRATAGTFVRDLLSTVQNG
ncbi:hypothetical protein [Streptomyces sp. NPDC058108]|uniref:hypothetical protein n=1 Tax=Streptomyces sp. NPDC058108 TaxID=3346344 RepID=UPI0036E55935